MEEDKNKGLSEATEVNRLQNETKTKRYSEIIRDFDNLDLFLISSDTDDLSSDSFPEPVTPCIPSKSNAQTGSADVLVCAVVEGETDGNASAQEADVALCRCENGVETAMQYAKMWCRYAKDLLAWMEKRISLEQEFAKNVIKTSEGAKASLASQDSMPLRYIYAKALEQDINNCVSSRKTAELVQNRCYQALSSKRNEIDKWCREFKEQWAKGQRRMNEAVSSLKKARQQYYQRCEELEKIKALTAKTVDDTLGIKTLDKRRRSKDEAQSKVMEAELLYRQCVYDARIQQDELVKVKERIISHIRKLICQGDTVLQEATVNMFYYQRQHTEAIPLGYQNLELICRSAEPGEPYLRFILTKRRPEQPLQIFTFQEFDGQGKRIKRKSSNPLNLVQDASPDGSPNKHPSETRRIGYSDSESIGGSLESLSSPVHTNRRIHKPLFLEDLEDRENASESECLDGPQVKVRTPSKATLTHRLRKTKSKMVKCKQCENYIVVNGVECVECGLALHKKCMEVCQTECEFIKGTVFGIDLAVLLRDSPDDVPFVVQQCTSEIESRALYVQGIYRVSGSKPRIQKICRAFEIHKEQVDLSELSPHDISSILKHFFKELPEPLLSFDLYNDLIAVGKTLQNQSEKHPDTKEVLEVIQRLQILLQTLPPYSYSTLRHIIFHLQRVSEDQENKMSACNLGIVFGPTLLRPAVALDVPMTALLETSYQALLIEFLITHHGKIFGLPQSSPASEVTNQPLPDDPQRHSQNMDEVFPRPQNERSTRERPTSLETRTMKRESSEGYISDKSSSNEAVDQLSPEANERAVVAVGVASDRARAEVVENTAQPRHRFTRQPVKYHRNQSTGLPNPVRITRQNTDPDRKESPDSSRSPSPVVRTQKRPEALNIHGDDSRRSLQVIDPADDKMDAPLSPREVVEYMLGIDSMQSPTASRATASSPETEAKNFSGCGQRRALCQSPKTVERHVTSPAQKILSGLKLRRSHSGKDEQLFV